MDKEQKKQIEEMRGMPDDVLVWYYSVIVTATHNAKMTAQFERYQRDRVIELYAQEEIIRRLQGRDQRQGFKPF